MNRSGFVTIEEEQDPATSASSVDVGPESRRPPRRRQASSALAGNVDRSLEFRRLRHRAAEFTKLPDDWDLYGAGPLGQRGADFLSQVIDLAEDLPWLPPPRMQPVDGGAVFEWRIGAHLSAYLEVSDIAVVFSVKRDGREIMGGANAAFSVATVEDVLQRMHSELLDE